MARKPKAPKPSKAPKPPKAPKPASRRRSAKEEAEEAEPLEGHVEDHPEGEDVDFEVDVDCDMDDEDGDLRSRRYEYKVEGLFGPDGVFGPDGPFGPRGPFGDQGPFGPKGIFGPDGLFNQNKRRKRRGGPRRRTKVVTAPMRRGRMFGAGELRLVMLAMFAEEPRHGYEFIKAMEEMTDGAYSPSPGVVYPTIQMLSDEGLIEAEDSEDSRKLYRATAAGLDELEERADELEELFTRLGRKAEKARSHGGSPEVLRALGNLAAVVSNKAKSGGFNKVDGDMIVDLIDQLARKIERL
ncbi:MAG: helix-turn-helix transcriptional regulator [Alteraurantiacibacter sp.]